MCNQCDYNSPDNQIYIDPLTDDYYMDIEISEWDQYDGGYIRQRIYIDYCPWCGRKLSDVIENRIIDHQVHQKYYNYNYETQTYYGIPFPEHDHYTYKYEDDSWYEDIINDKEQEE